jgi:hypothetical protein
MEGGRDDATDEGGSVVVMSPRPRIDVELVIDGAPTSSETTCTWAGAHVVTIHTVVPRADLAIELHSTFVGHPGVPTHAVHLRLGPPGRQPAIVAAEIGDPHVEPTYAPRACAYEHAQRLIEVFAEFGHEAAVNVPGDAAFGALERAALQPRGS